MPPNPAVERKPWHASYSSGDIMLAALGVVLAIICALFPWYIFYNQEQFGIRALKFEGNGEAGAGLAPRLRLSAEPMTLPDIAPAADAEVDPVATGTLLSKGAPRTPPPGLDDQPFPFRPQDFRLIHVANGLAMIEDERGLWLVRPGSMLPDASRVSAIEQHAGRWVLVTDKDGVVAIAD